MTSRRPGVIKPHNLTLSYNGRAALSDFRSAFFIIFGFGISVIKQDLFKRRWMHTFVPWGYMYVSILCYVLPGVINEYVNPYIFTQTPKEEG